MRKVQNKNVQVEYNLVIIRNDPDIKGRIMKDIIDAVNYIFGGADFAGTSRRRCRSCRQFIPSNLFARGLGSKRIAARTRVGIR